MSRENGHIKMPIALMEKLFSTRIPGECTLILNYIIRQTYGWHKDSDSISIYQFSQSTGIKKPNVIRALSSLITHNVIRNDNGNYSLNNDFPHWLTYNRNVIRNDNTKIIKKDNVIRNDNAVIENDNTPLSETITNNKESKDTVKDTIQKIIYAPYVSLTKKQYEDLTNRFGEQGTKDRIEKLSLYQRSKGKRYKDHYATILHWEKMNQSRGGSNGKARAGIIPRFSAGKKYESPEEFDARITKEQSSSTVE